jgi:CMP-N-acetylneuraminic acid synthetase
MDNILITICARGNSKGIPGKNIKKLGNFPLIYFTINIAKEFLKNKKGKISLSTDDPQIKSISEDFGIITDYIRPSYLATDNAGKVDTIKDILLYEEIKSNNHYDMILDLDVSSPLRTIRDLEESYNVISSKKDAFNLFSVSKADKNPYFNMVEIKDDNYYKLVKNNPEGNYLNRQSIPKVYNLNASFYWYRRSFFDSNFNTVMTEKSLIYELDHICFDLDNELDFQFMEYLYNENKLNFLL